MILTRQLFIGLLLSLTWGQSHGRGTLSCVKTATLSKAKDPKHFKMQILRCAQDDKKVGNVLFAQSDVLFAMVFRQG